MVVAGGGLRSAVLLLRKVGMPDCAQALAQAVAEAQLDSKQGSADAGEICWCCCLSCQSAASNVIHSGEGLAVYLKLSTGSGHHSAIF